MTDARRRVRAIERVVAERDAQALSADWSLVNGAALAELLDVAAYPPEWQTKAAPTVETIQTAVGDARAALLADLVALGLNACSSRSRGVA